MLTTPRRVGAKQPVHSFLGGKGFGSIALES